MLALLVFLLGAEAVNVLDVFLVRDSLHASDASYGLIAALVGVGLKLGSLSATRLRTASQRILMLVLTLAGLSLVMVAQGLAPDLTVLAVLTVLSGAADGLLNSAFAGLVVDRTDDAVRGRVAAAINALTRTVALLALGCGALAGAIVGPRTGFVCFGALSDLTVLLLGRRLHTLRTTAHPATGAATHPVNDPSGGLREVATATARSRLQASATADST